MKKYTEKELLKKFKNKYIEVYRHYDYYTKESTFEVRSIKKECWENHNLPEEIISWYK
tara:strand:+ start:87 stop:260 length:174 start_codon:yes stop_codon:yes gene_type:complete